MKTAAHVCLGILAGTILGFTTSTSSAQGSAITYQGRLTDGGNAAGGVYDLRFGLFDASGGGLQLGGHLTYDNIPISNGVFTVSLDFGANKFTGEDRWLEIGVRPGASTGAFTNLTPRQLLTSAPYAVRAANFSGTIASSQLSGTYANPVTFNHAGNSFSGSGVGLTSLNANNLSSGTVPAAALSNAWKITGNASTTAGTHFLGTTDNQPLELRANNQRGLRVESATAHNIVSMNVIGGSGGNYVSNGVAGATISGGGNSFGSGNTNRVLRNFGTIGGGERHTTSGEYATIVGGYANTAAGTHTTIGGVGNIASGNFSVISGGSGNAVASNASAAVIGGGIGNDILADAEYATLSGGRANTIGTVADNTTIGGGVSNLVSAGAVSATIAGGERNGIGTNSIYGVIAGGKGNSIADEANNATIAGGGENDVGFETDYAVIAGGSDNAIGSFSDYAAITGGRNNNVGALADYATIGGGHQNSVSSGGLYATVPGGRQNTAAGDYAFAAGRRAKASHTGAFVWADATDADFSSTSSNQFLVRATGGVGMGENNPLAALHVQSENLSVAVGALENDDLIVEAQDAALGLYSQNQGTYGSALAFKEVQGDGSIQDTWGWVRKSSAGSSEMLLTYGGNKNYAVNPVMMVIRTNGNVGVSLNTPTARLHVNGTGRFENDVFVDGDVTITGTINPPSDRNVKQDFDAVDPMEILRKVAALPIQSWAYKSSPETRHIGPVAQDFHAAFEFNGNDDKHIATVDADGVALAAIQGLNLKLEAKLEQKETEIAELKQSVNELKKLVQAMSHQLKRGAE